MSLKRLFSILSIAMLSGAVQASPICRFITGGHPGHYYFGYAIQMPRSSQNVCRKEFRFNFADVGIAGQNCVLATQSLRKAQKRSHCKLSGGWVRVSNDIVRFVYGTPHFRAYGITRSCYFRIQSYYKQEETEKKTGKQNSEHESDSNYEDGNTNWCGKPSSSSKLELTSPTMPPSVPADPAPSSKSMVTNV